MYQFTRFQGDQAPVTSCRGFVHGPHGGLHLHPHDLLSPLSAHPKCATTGYIALNSVLLIALYSIALHFIIIINIVVLSK